MSREKLLVLGGLLAVVLACGGIVLAIEGCDSDSAEAYGRCIRNGEALGLRSDVVRDGCDADVGRW